MRTVHLAPQHHPFGENHVRGAPNREEGDFVPEYAPRAPAETPNPPPRFDLTTPATAQQVDQQTHDTKGGGCCRVGGDIGGGSSGRAEYVGSVE